MKFLIKFVLFVLEFLKKDKTVLKSVGPAVLPENLKPQPEIAKPLLTGKIPQSNFFTWEEALYLPKLNLYYSPTEEEKKNIVDLALKLDVIRDHYGKPMPVNVWIRPTVLKDNELIDYNKLIGGAPNSAHKNGMAVDISDPKEEIEDWCDANRQILERLGLFMEAREDTLHWAHFQTRPTKSWRFKP